MFDIFKKKKSEQPKKFPPVPTWKPRINQPLDKIINRISHYTNASRDFAVFTNGTIVLLPDWLSNSEAEEFAKNALHKVFHAHPDMRQLNMKDGNLLIQYNHDAMNVVLDETSQEHWNEIETNHQQALATSEVLITPLGQNTFDDFGKKALFGRCFMFMDAQNPIVIRVERKSIKQ